MKKKYYGGLLALLCTINLTLICWPPRTSLINFRWQVQNITIDNGNWHLALNKQGDRWLLDGEEIDRELLERLLERLVYHCDQRYGRDEFISQLPPLPLRFSVDGHHFQVLAYNQASQRYGMQDEKHVYLCRPELFSTLSTKKADWLSPASVAAASGRISPPGNSAAPHRSASSGE